MDAQLLGQLKLALRVGRALADRTGDEDAFAAIDGAYQALAGPERQQVAINRTKEETHRTNLTIEQLCQGCWHQEGRRRWFGRLPGRDTWDRLLLCRGCYQRLTSPREVSAAERTPNGARRP